MRASGLKSALLLPPSFLSQPRPRIRSERTRGKLRFVRKTRQRNIRPPISHRNRLRNLRRINDEAISIHARLRHHELPIFARDLEPRKTERLHHQTRILWLEENA